jgi:hypothetical protein
MCFNFWIFIDSPDFRERQIRLVHQNVRNFHCDFPGCTQIPFKQHAHLRKHRLTVHKLTDAGSPGSGSSGGPPRGGGSGALSGVPGDMGPSGGP